MDGGENNGKPYFLMDDLGFFPLFLETPISSTIPGDNYFNSRFDLQGIDSCDLCASTVMTLRH